MVVNQLNLAIIICFEEEMIDNMMYVQQYLHSLECELWDVDHLDVNQFVRKLQMYHLIGWEQKIVAMIRQAIHEFQNQRIIYKYLRIADKLLKVPGYQNAVGAAIVDIFCEIFYFLNLQKCSKDLEELKILRKFWVGTIHPTLLRQMKQNLLIKTHIDIDNGIKPEMVNKIKDHYAKKLGMTPEQIKLQFPPPRVSEEGNKYNNQIYLVENQHVYPSNYYPPNSQIHQNSFNYQNFGHQNYLPYPNADRTIDAINMQEEQFYSEQTKRKRFASEETRVTNGLKSSDLYDSKPRKAIHRDEIPLDYKVMLSNLFDMNAFNCKECGMSFALEETHESHKNQHFKEKLMKIDGQNVENSGELCSEQSWGNSGEVMLSNDKFRVSESMWPQKQALCMFCCCQLTMQFKDDQWAFSNATIVSVQGRPQVMHKSCQTIFEQSLNPRS